jgi:hypothetical protein
MLKLCTPYMNIYFMVYRIKSNANMRFKFYTGFVLKNFF